MERKKFLIYGDSNTYGYDPADFFGGPYPEEILWTVRLQEAVKDRFEVIARGENGRRLPNPAGEYRYAEKLLEGMREKDVFAVMLGSNDLLITTGPDAALPVKRMEQFLSWLTGRKACPQILILGPPYIDGEKSPEPLMRRFYEESVRMNEGYRLLAEKYRVRFADAGKWNVPLAFDQIHLSKEGHRVFAEQMIRLLSEWN